MESRDGKKAALRDTIVRNAIRLFTERGYDAVSLEEIAKASACSRSTFHRYFGTKEDLLFPTAADWRRGLEMALRSADPDSDPWTVARRALTEAARGFLDDIEPDVRSECIGLWFSEPLPRRRYLEIVFEYEAEVAGYLANRMQVDRRDSLECQLVAAAMTSAIRAALNTAVHTGADLEELVGRAFDMVEPGLHSEVPVRARAR